MTEVAVRAYGPLNDFLPLPRKHTAFVHVVDGHPGVKDLLEGLGIPHPEIDLILIDGRSVPFDFAVPDSARIAVFPRFMSLDVSKVTLVRPPPLGVVRFVADVHLGKLARLLRLLGLDTVYASDADDAALADVAGREQRILLTRDQPLLKRRVVVYGYYVRATRPHDQLVQVLRQFSPRRLAPFSRCLRCNHELREIEKAPIADSLLPRTREQFERFQTCDQCGRIYWQGSHYERLRRVVEGAVREMDRAVDAAPEDVNQSPPSST